ncbi:DUF29 domain-containing protein [Oscillatoria sp. CS-180]|uniref:DUF29 domain-containing protein n=1 Tax=Oscillatoria sp. CS-180 TaxID=3021720 RepID=UPI00232D14B0|nr:DUF29 domain-containing protein [Oscillatoria sp. CS-180]MDB9526463.1 DUF29 domain-containing protein [Oscillatoria sp. CS-180]
MTTVPSHSPSTPLYDRDYAAWLSQTALLLREGKLEAVDIVNLVEELEDMGRSEKRALESNLEILLRHLLKYQYQPDLRSNSWRFTLLEHRDRILKSFRDSPSLKLYFSQIFAEAYCRSRQKAAVETGLPIETFPNVCPFAPEAVLDTAFLPA